MSSNDSAFQRLLENNVEWAGAVVKADPDFFTRSAEGQSPKVLWIGCSDSRVPGSPITGSKPGDLFLHRNIANQVHLNDDNVLSVLDYAVAHLHVKHVVVVGHTDCGGAKYCVKESSHTPGIVPPRTPLERWLSPLVTLARELHLGSLPPPEALSILVKENVKRQVQNLAGTDTIKEAWGRGENVSIHGLLYDLSTGLLSDLGVTQRHPQ